MIQVIHFFFLSRITSYLTSAEANNQIRKKNTAACNVLNSSKNKISVVIYKNE